MYLQVRLVDAANHSFANSQIMSYVTNRHHLPQIHDQPRQALCIITLRHDSGQHGIQYTLANSTFQPRCFDEQHGAIHSNPWCMWTMRSTLTSPNHVATPALRTSITRRRSRHSQMKNAIFSPAGQRLIASNPYRLVQFSRGHLGSHGETALDTAHQTELTTFRIPTTTPQINNAPA